MMLLLTGGLVTVAGFASLFGSLLGSGGWRFSAIFATWGIRSPDVGGPGILGPRSCTPGAWGAPGCRNLDDLLGCMGEYTKQKKISLFISARLIKLIFITGLTKGRRGCVFQPFPRFSLLNPLWTWFWYQYIGIDRLYPYIHPAKLLRIHDVIIWQFLWKIDENSKFCFKVLNIVISQNFWLIKENDNSNMFCKFQVHIYADIFQNGNLKCLKS